MYDSDPTLRSAASRFAEATRELARAAHGSDNYLSAELEEILSLIGEQEELRVFVDGTRNLGHQGSTVTLVKRLIDLTSFAGRLVVVYADHGRPNLGRTLDKLALMFAGLDPTDPASSRVSYGTCKNISFLNFDSRSELRKPVAFGFTGGADEMSTNYALQLNVRYFARIQPYLWDDDSVAKQSAHYESSRIEQPDGRHLYLVDALPEFGRLAIRHNIDRVASIDPKVWDWYCDRQLFDKDLARRTKNARSVYSQLSLRRKSSRDRMVSWPSYGLQHFRGDVPEMFLVMVLCALRLQRHLQRPIGLISFSPHEQLADWDHLISALSNDLESGRADLPLLQSGIRSKYAHDFRAGRFCDDRLREWIHALSEWLFDSPESYNRIRLVRTYDAASGLWSDLGTRDLEPLDRAVAHDVYVVEMGPVAMDIFHHCLALSELPPIIEGQATSNLLTTLGRPFLQVLRSEHVIKNGYGILDADSDYESNADRACSMALLIRELKLKSWLQSEVTTPASDYLKSINDLVAFVLKVSDQSRDASRYFQSLGQHFAKNENDKLLIALLAMREVIMSNQTYVLPQR